MSLQVVTIESESGCEIIGIYLNEKLGKSGMSDFMDKSDMKFKRKVVKKEDIKRLIYVEDSKESNKKLFMTTVPFVMPSTGKSKKLKDPNAPRKSLSAFMLFSNDHRKIVKESSPDATFGDVGRMVGAAWKELKEKEKSFYTKAAALANKEYLSEMEKYTASTETPTETVEPTEIVASVSTEKPKKTRVKKET